MSMNHGSGVPVLRTVCVVQAMDQFGIFLGTFIPLSDSSQVVAVVSAALGVVVMLFVMYLLLRDRSVMDNLGDNDYGFTGDSSALSAESCPSGTSCKDAPSEGLEEAASPAVSLDELAGRYFLSTREVDILGLLVAGRSGPYIADRLCISANTVKTHIRHIYTKLDVHDRQELLDLVHLSL